MGWASGSELMVEIIAAVKAEVKDKAVRQRIYKKCIAAFEDADCDTLYECEGEDEAFDQALSSK